MRYLIPKTLAVMFILSFSIFAQKNFNVAIAAGSGTISSDSPYYSGFSTSLSIGMGNLYSTVTPRLSIYYSGDFNSLLPASDRIHYPHIAGIGIKGIYALRLQGDFFYEQSLGLFAAEDRVFSTSTGWGAGFIISVLGGADLRSSSDSGFRIGLGGEYGLTVYNRYIRYLGLFFEAQYIISY